MAKTVQNVKDSIRGMLTGLNLNNVTNLNGTLERTARELAQWVDIPDVIGRSSLTLYDGVTDYTAPTGIFGSAIVDLRRQGASRNASDFAYQQNIETFDRTKDWVTTGWQATFEYVNGVQRLRVATAIPDPRLELDPMTDDVGWTAAGSAGSLAEDDVVYWDAPASLRFTLTGSSTGTLTKTIGTVDLTDYKDSGVAFLAIRTPAISTLTNIVLRVGSDASNYYSVTETDGFLGAWVVNEWLLTAFDLSGKSTTGTPDDDATDYVQLRIAHTATITNFYVGGLWIARPSPHYIYHQTASFFQASGSSPSASITSDSDSVVLDDSALLLYEHLAALNIALGQGGTRATPLVEELQMKLFGRGIKPGLVDIYRGDNPSQQLRVVGSYLD